MARFLRDTLLTSLLPMLFASVCTAAERAASIEYEFVERPETRTEFIAPTNATLRFLAIKAIDGFRVEAALGEPMSAAPGSTPLIISVHGSGGRYDQGTPAFLIRSLPRQRYSVLPISTRQSGDKANTDNFFEIRRDIEAAVYTARALGYRAIVLHGHSLGNIQVQYYAANNWDSDIKAVVLTGMFGNLPWKSRRILVQNEQAFAQLHEAALTSVKEKQEAELLAVRMPRGSGEAVPVTGQHFLTYRAEESSSADGTYWIRRIPRPILMIRDAGDTIVQAFEPFMLLAAATTFGSLVPDIKYVLLPNEKGPNPGGHDFTDNQEQLGSAIVAWLKEHNL